MKLYANYTPVPKPPRPKTCEECSNEVDKIYDITSFEKEHTFVCYDCAHQIATEIAEAKVEDIISDLMCLTHEND